MAPKNPSVNCFRKFKRLQLTFQVVSIIRVRTTFNSEDDKKEYK